MIYTLLFTFVLVKSRLGIHLAMADFALELHLWNVSLGMSEDPAWELVTEPAETRYFTVVSFLG